MEHERHVYASAAKIRKTYDVSLVTLRRWGDSGRVRVVRLPGGRRRYHSDDISAIFGQGAKTEAQVPRGARICYARVSSEHQRPDLERQVEHLRNKYPDHEIVADVGSGINWNRRGFTSILERAMRGEVGELVVSRRDRLCRFAFELVERVLAAHDVRLVVLGSDVHSVAGGGNEGDVEDPEDKHELADDLLAIINVFVARHNGLRSAANRRLRRAEAAKDGETLRPREDRGRGRGRRPATSGRRAALEAPKVARDGEVDV